MSRVLCCVPGCFCCRLHLVDAVIRHSLTDRHAGLWALLLMPSCVHACQLRVKTSIATLPNHDKPSMPQHTDCISPLPSPLFHLLPTPLSAYRTQLFDWHFDIFAVHERSGGHSLYVVTLALLEHYGLFDGWLLNRQTVQQYLIELEQRYLRNPYHNSLHAADVTQARLAFTFSQFQFYTRTL